MDAPLRLAGTVVVNGERELSEAWVLGGRITFEQPVHSGPVDTVEGFVLPGLVDVHCHVGVTTAGATEPDLAEKQAAADRDAGVLLIRDAGSALDTSWINERDDLPRIIRSGRFIARPMRYMRNLPREVKDVADLPAVAADEARRSDGWVKLIADWIDRDLGDAGDLRPLWPDDVLAEAIAAAQAEGARITAHTFATEAVDPLIEGGIDCIEHGTGMTPEQIQRAASMSIPVVPTLLQIAQFESIAAQGEAKYPVFAARMRGMHARRHQQVRDFRDAGIQMYVGTDAGGSIGHGSLPEEAAEMVAAGLPAPEVVAAASWEAREWLGVPGIEEGAPADVVVYAGDPREDIAVLARPLAVLLRGSRH